MKKLEKPKDEVGSVFTICISNYNEPLKTKLLNFKTNIIKASNIYDQKASKTLLQTIDSDLKLEGKVTKDEMTNVYNHKMARKGQPGRVIYDKIISAPINDMCPLCGYRIVSTLDHYLPESLYPIYSITPTNLVPSCFDCNKIKIALVLAKAEAATLHPYFDNIEEEQWLFAQVKGSSPASVLFMVSAPKGLSKNLYIRIENHFKIFKLSTLYGTYAAVELLNIRFKLNKIFDLGGKVQVQKRLLEDLESFRAANINSWQTAMYAALSNDEWFYSGGFKK